MKQSQQATIAPIQPARCDLTNRFQEELARFAQYPQAGRVDQAPAELLDVLFAYRLFMGRWPEFDGVDQFEEKSNPHSLYQFARGFLTSPECQARFSDLWSLDLVVMHERPDGMRLFFNLKDRQGVRIATGLHEPEIQEAMRSVLRPGMVCVDAGAHIGMYALLMAGAAGANGRVYAFEPFASTYDLLVKNIRENHLADTIIPTQAACHEASGVGLMHLPDGDDLGPAYVTRAPDDAAGVRLVRIDDIVPADQKVGLVKMDIEGSEPFAFAGMPRIINNDRPVIFTEFIPGALGQDPKHYLQQLHEARYRLYEVHDFLGSRGEFQFQGGTETVNLVCLPAERLDEFTVR